jgi:hypothetical protein
LGNDQFEKIIMVNKIKILSRRFCFVSRSQWFTLVNPATLEVEVERISKNSRPSLKNKEIKKGQGGPG